MTQVSGLRQDAARTPAFEPTWGAFNREHANV
jgi:hypothetical protein